MRKIISAVLSFSLIFQQTGFAQVVGQLDIAAHLNQIKAPLIQDHFRPIHLRYLAFDESANSFKLLLDKGDLGEKVNEGLSSQTQKLMQYFLIGLALPNSTFWVNLRPDAPDNIIADALGQTDIGRIMLEADVQLKKDVASFTSVDMPEGREYWDKLYKKAGELFGTEQVEIPTFTRPWIVPGEIILREAGGQRIENRKQKTEGLADGIRTTDDEASAYIYKATLKVMLEEDYVRNTLVGAGSQPALRGRAGLEPAPTIADQLDFRYKALNEYSSELIRQLIIPKITRDVNSAKRYASLRQVYYSLILAQWFKERQKTEVRSQKTASATKQPTDKTSQTGKTGQTGITESIDSGSLEGLISKTTWSKMAYFQAYEKSFKDGEYNQQEMVYSAQGQIIRRYVSGGVLWKNMGVAPIISSSVILPEGMMKHGFSVEYSEGKINVGSPVVNNPAVLDELSQTAGNPLQPGSRRGILSRANISGKWSSFTQRFNRENIAEFYNGLWAMGRLYSAQKRFKTSLDEDVGDFTVRVYKGKIEDAQSVAWVTQDENKRPQIHFMRKFLIMLSEAEIAAVLAHELGHPDNRDIELVKEMQRISNEDEVSRAEELLQAHKQIEADKKAIQLLDKLGYPRYAFFSMTEKLDALIGKDSAFNLRRKILAQRIQKPDGRLDYYMPFYGLNKVLSLGIRKKILNGDIRNVRQRAEDLLILGAELYQVTKANNNGREGLMERIEADIQEYNDDPNKFVIGSQSRRVLFKILVDLALVYYMSKDIGEEPESLDDIYVRDILRNHKQDLDMVLDRMLQKDPDVSTTRIPSTKTKALGKYHPGKSQVLVDLDADEFLTEFTQWVEWNLKHPIPDEILDAFGPQQPPVAPEGKPSSDKDGKGKRRLRFIPFILIPIIFWWPFPHKVDTHNTFNPPEISSYGYHPGGKCTYYNPFDPDHRGHQTADGSSYPEDLSHHAIVFDSTGGMRFQDGGWVAVDKNKILLGSEIKIIFPDFSHVTLVARDTGRAVTGDMLDLSVNRSDPASLERADDKLKGALVVVNNRLLFMIGVEGEYSRLVLRPGIPQPAAPSAEEIRKEKAKQKGEWGFFLLPIPTRRKKDKKNPSSSAHTQQGSSSITTIDPGLTQEPGKFNPGGIDLRSLKNTQSSAELQAVTGVSVEGATSFGDDASSLAGTVEQQRKEIEGLIDRKVVPAYERVEQYALACCKVTSPKNNRDSVLSIISDIMILEEDYVIPTSPRMRQLLIALESGTS